MRYVSSLPPMTTSSETRQVRRLGAVYGVRPVNLQAQAEPNVEQHVQEHVAGVKGKPQNVPQPFVVERRKSQRRVMQRPVAVELRSGLDRRQYHLIDETA